VEPDRQWPADEIRIDGELDGLTRVRGEKKLAPVLGEIGVAPFGRAALPNLDLENSLRRAADVVQVDVQGKWTAELKDAMKPHARLDEHIGTRRPGRDNFGKQDNAQQVKQDKTAESGIARFL
jgi:hypothetical protein